jgi:hypothetical protein
MCSRFLFQYESNSNYKSCPLNPIKSDLDLHGEGRCAKQHVVAGAPFAVA